MSPFQEQAITILGNALREADLEYNITSIEGRTENYIRANIVGTAFDLFVYVDEAGIQGTNIDYRFEKYDYDTEQDLIAAFVSKTMEMAKSVANQAL